MMPLLHVPHLKLRTIISAATFRSTELPCPKPLRLLSCLRPSLDTNGLYGGVDVWSVESR